MYTRKKKPCPDCGKLIHIISNKCRRCSQLGTLNNHYVNGRACGDRKCLVCNKSISPGSLKGLCMSCRNALYTGKGNPNYKFGHFLRKFYNTELYKTWRMSVYSRDHFTCKLCGGTKSGTLRAHHIFPKRDFPDLVYDINNGITLCKNCHEKTYKKEYEFITVLKQIIMAEIKLCEIGEHCDVNTEPSQNFLEGVTTRDEINFPTSTGQPL